MSCLDRYIALAFIRGWLLALLILLAIFTLFVVVEELDRIDSGYQLVDALRFIALTTPQRTLDLAPVSTLLGSLSGLAMLAKHSELIAVRAAGIPLTRLVQSVALPTLLLMASLLLVAEHVAAPLHQDAEARRVALRSGKLTLLNGTGLWSNNGLRYFSVHRLQLGHIPEGIELYEFSPDGQLRSAIHADRADISEKREWTLIDVQYKQIISGHVVRRYLKRLEMGPFWLPEELPLLSLSTASMSLTALYGYARHLGATGQRPERYELAFWRKSTLPVATGVMVLLAIPIGAGVRTQRSSAFGRRIAIGAIVGILFYLGTQMIYGIGSMLKLNPALIALLPILLVLAVAVYLLTRLR